MKVGTKSLLFGVHAFWWHPITVALAWRKINKKWPPFWGWVACFVHDLGYWGSSNMDGKEGKLHPIRSARIMLRILKFFRAGRVNRFVWTREVANHSRSLCCAAGVSPSVLCWADKLSMVYDPEWFYLLRATLSKEILEYRDNAVPRIGRREKHSVWFRDLRAIMVGHVEKNTRSFVCQVGGREIQMILAGIEPEEYLEKVFGDGTGLSK